MKQLWVEQYRPRSLDDYVWVDLEMRATVEHWLKDGALPHCLFSGAPGTGKTSLAKLLFRQLGIPDGDILYVNASRERQIDAFQARVVNFVDAWALGPSGIKYVLLDEADKMSQTAQGLLRNEMETYSDVCRFVLSANYPQKIIPALHSRLQQLHFPSLDKDDYTMRVASVLDTEGVAFEPEILIDYVEQTFPDLRKCINLCQQRSTNGVLKPLPKGEGIAKDYLISMLDLLRGKKYLDARKLLVQVQSDAWDEFYRGLYENLNLFGYTQDHRDEALLIIRNALVHHAVVADAEINAAACLIELSRVGAGT